MKIKSHSRLFCASFMVCAFSLTGCSNSEPTEAEMFETLNDFRPTKMLLGDLATMKAEAKKAGCEKLGENTYKCGVASKDGKNIVLKYAFTKVDGKWKISL